MDLCELSYSSILIFLIPNGLSLNWATILGWGCVTQYSSLKLSTLVRVFHHQYRPVWLLSRGFHLWIRAVTWGIPYSQERWVLMHCAPFFSWGGLSTDCATFTQRWTRVDDSWELGDGQSTYTFLWVAFSVSYANSNGAPIDPLSTAGGVSASLRKVLKSGNFFWSLLVDLVDDFRIDAVFSWMMAINLDG